MRPRTEVMSFRPPVTLADLEGRIPRSGYVLVTEENSDEVVSAIPLTQLPEIPDERLERYSEEVVYVPWLATAATAFDAMRRRDRRVAVVVNEYGETVGVLTFDDVLDTIFSDSASRSSRLMNRLPIRRMRAGVWQVTGMTSLRRLKRYFHLDRAVGKSVTIAGVMQEALQRVPEIGDECHWAGFRLKVIDAPQRGQLLIEMKRTAGSRPAAEARG